MKIWSVNTNQTNHGDEVAKLFLKQNRIILWYRDEKPNLKHIQKGDLVLAYHNELRVIAVGFALSERTTCDNFEKEEFVDVDWIWKNLENPIQLNNIQSENKVKMFNGSIFNWTENIDTKKLLSEIGIKKSLKMIEKR
jgi:hypothetical protein